MSDYVLPEKSDAYACNTSNWANVYIFKILDLKIPTSDSHQCQKPLERFRKRDTNGDVFITYRRESWFAISALYENKTHTNSYRQVTFHNVASIKFFDKTPDNATISIVFNKFIASIHEYKYAGWTPEELIKCTCLMLLNYLMNPVANLHWYIKSCKILEKKGLDSHHNKLSMLLLNMSRLQSWPSPTPRPNPMPGQRGHPPTQRIPYVWRLIHQHQRKSIAWRRTMTELLCWMNFFIPSRHLYRKKLYW